MITVKSDGRMHSTRGMINMTGRRIARSSAAWRRFSRTSSDWTLQHPGDGDTGTLGLYERTDEETEILDIGPVQEAVERLGPGHTEADVLERAAELISEGVVVALGTPVQARHRSPGRPRRRPLI